MDLRGEIVSFIILSFIICVVNGRPRQDPHKRHQHVHIPQNWKDLLTREVYEQHAHQPRGHNNLFESDIKKEDFRQPTPTGAFRNAIVDRNLRWERGVVPYTLSDNYAEAEKQVIEEALRDMMYKTCIRFVRRTTEKDYIAFLKRNMGCSSYIGRIGGEQPIDLMTGCIYQIGEVQHEVMHAIGFYHEQSRTDRDQYVTIVWNNVMQGAEDQFSTYRTDNLDMPYDFESIMHYGWNYFAKDSSLPTIIPKTTSQQPKSLGNRKVMTAYDVEKINRLYECSHDSITTAATTTKRKYRTRPTLPRYQPTPERPKTNNPYPPNTSLWSDFKDTVKRWMEQFAHT
ncbi:astacin-like [Paramacrobiotus metropolitanus]|uniref:astacin-like n=1 Tax=Paramacrobiotus metropolitanus TaxID=2943436 RepID=UPI0024460AA3|nr:astacin-like [Paramacrobiotus metropolitanus]